MASFHLLVRFPRFGDHCGPPPVLSSHRHCEGCRETCSQTAMLRDLPQRRSTLETSYRVKPCHKHSSHPLTEPRVTLSEALQHVRVALAILENVHPSFRPSESSCAIAAECHGPGHTIRFDTYLPGNDSRRTCFRFSCRPLPFSGCACRCTVVLHLFVLGCSVAKCMFCRVQPARKCREASECVRTNTFVRDSEVPDGKHHFCERAVLRGAADKNSSEEKKKKDGIWSSLAKGRARLVVLAVEVGGRCSQETSGLLASLAKACARSETACMRKRAEQAWRLRWCGPFGCAAAQAFAASLLELQCHLCKLGRSVPSPAKIIVGTVKFKWHVDEDFCRSNFSSHVFQPLPNVADFCLQ